MTHATPPRTGNLRDDCVAEALAIVERDGLDKLSLREVARRLGVSHQAPYKHYPSRDHLLAEMARRAYDEFAAHLDSRPPTCDPDADLGAMGQAYIAYALSHPLQYRLMFGTSLPDPENHRAMLGSARHAFGLLRDALRRRALGRADRLASVDMDALFIWSTMHGLASILRSDVGRALELPADFASAVVPHVLARIGEGLGGEPAKAREV